MKLAIIFFSFLLNSAFANICEENYSYEFPKGKKEICLLKKEKLLVNKKCLPSLKCKAVKSLSIKKLSKITLDISELEDGKNPATLLCKKLEGKLILTKSNLGHEEFFCKFDDGSLISTSSQFMKYQDIKNE